MRVVTYSRVSTNHHDQNPEIQVLELRKYCESRGWTIVEEIRDFGSGGTTDREGLRKLNELVDGGSVDCVAVTKLDRLFRSLRNLVTTLDHFQAAKVCFVATKDAIDYTMPSGRLFAQILGSLAEFEKTLIRERTIAGLEYARDIKGKTLGRPKRIRNIELILHLRREGLSVRKIARLAGCSPATVSRELVAASKRSVV